MLPVFGYGCKSEHATNALTRPSLTEAVTAVLPTRRASGDGNLPCHQISEGATIDGDPRPSPAGGDPTRPPESCSLQTSYRPSCHAVGDGTTCDEARASQCCVQCELKARSSCPQPQIGLVVRVHAAWSCVYRTGTPPKHKGTARIVEPFTTGADTAICEAQRFVVEALDLDGSTLFELGADADLICTHAWWRPEVPAPPARLSVRESFPQILERLKAGELVSLSSPDELPDGTDRASFIVSTSSRRFCSRSRWGSGSSG